MRSELCYVGMTRAMQKLYKHPRRVSPPVCNRMHHRPSVPQGLPASVWRRCGCVPSHWAQPVAKSNRFNNEFAQESFDSTASVSPAVRTELAKVPS
jgi:hypothetical protein